MHTNVHPTRGVGVAIVERIWATKDEYEDLIFYIHQTNVGNTVKVRIGHRRLDKHNLPDMYVVTLNGKRWDCFMTPERCYEAIDNFLCGQIPF